MSEAAITVLLVDDHAVVREGYRRLLERAPGIEVLGEAANADEAVARVEELMPRVVVMDISLPGCSGIEATRRVLAIAPAVAVLVFSMHEDVVYARRALQAGALGYLTKAGAPEALLEALRCVAAGGRYIDPAVDAAAGGRPTVPDGGVDALSPRELEVLRLLVQGLPVRGIAERLGVTPKTVANQQTLIRQKLGAGTPLQLLRAAGRLGLLDEA